MCSCCIIRLICILMLVGSTKLRFIPFSEQTADWCAVWPPPWRSNCVKAHSLRPTCCFINDSQINCGAALWRQNVFQSAVLFVIRCLWLGLLCYWSAGPKGGGQRVALGTITMIEWCSIMGALFFCFFLIWRDARGIGRIPNPYTDGGREGRHTDVLRKN